MANDLFSFQIGDYRCAAIRDSSGEYPLGMFMANLSPEIYRPWLAARGEIEQIRLPYLCLLVETGIDRVLIDTGYGRVPNPPGRLQELVREMEFEADAISKVILSHVHPDHVEGCLDANGKPAFPNARYYLSHKEWEYWTEKPRMDELNVDQAFKDDMLLSAERTLAGLDGVLDLVHPGTEIAAGITVEEAYGHSPGHLVARVQSAGEELLFLADTVVHPLHLEYPGTVAVTDHFGEETVAARRRWLAYAAQRGCLVGTSHFDFPGLGRVIAKGAAWKWSPL